MFAKISLKYGLILGVTVSLATQILTWLGLGLTNWFVVVSVILTMAFIAFAAQKIQVIKCGQLTFINALGLVIIMVLVARLIFQVYMFIYTRYVDPLWVDSVAESWALTLQESGSTAEQVESQIQNFRKAYEPLPMFTVALVMYAIPQFFWGLITVLFFVFDVKNKFKKQGVTVL